MKHARKLLSLALIVAAVSSLSVSAHAADYSFTTESPSDYYSSTSYEDVYGSEYNYGGPNVVDYQIPELEYGSFSTTQTGLMEKAEQAMALLPGTAYMWPLLKSKIRLHPSSISNRPTPAWMA